VGCGERIGKGGNVERNEERGVMWKECYWLWQGVTYLIIWSGRYLGSRKEELIHD